MPRPKKFTEFIFGHIRDPKKKELYGDLGLMYEFFEAITIARQQQYLSQRQLAEKAGIKQSALAKIEAGRSNPTLSTLIKIVSALGLNLKIMKRD
jgi:ribosome-binding protein aMBF1 (putative translation factor)